MGWDWGTPPWRYFPPPPPKLPPPRHGIKVKRFGATWWGQRWIEALEHLGYTYAARLRRGRSYARQGRVHDLDVEGGEIRALVTGSRPRPYQVTIRVAALADRVWEKAIEVMARRAAFAARLLTGQMPQEIDQAFRSAGGSLFPESTRDLSTRCTCPDWANPCKHVAAVHYVLGEAFDRDPFLLFELRGRSREQVLDALRRHRAAPEAAAPPRARRARREASIHSSAVAPEQYERFREHTDDLTFHITRPAVSGAVLRQLGAPPSWGLPSNPTDLLYPAVAAAAELARELALRAGANGTKMVSA
ncbi:MAG: SWIM zinc finger family protein [Armatimonadota bacterium]|nr:SWIM zinc finger family protein [Armatimonadota bacterium]